MFKYTLHVSKALSGSGTSHVLGTQRGLSHRWWARWDDENVLELDTGDVCTASWMSLMVNFMSCIFCHNLKGKKNMSERDFKTLSPSTWENPNYYCWRSHKTSSMRFLLILQMALSLLLKHRWHHWRSASPQTCHTTILPSWSLWMCLSPGPHTHWLRTGAGHSSPLGFCLLCGKESALSALPTPGDASREGANGIMPTTAPENCRGLGRGSGSCYGYGGSKTPWPCAFMVCANWRERGCGRAFMWISMHWHFGNVFIITGFWKNLWRRPRLTA